MYIITSGVSTPLRGKWLRTKCVCNIATMQQCNKIVFVPKILPLEKAQVSLVGFCNDDSLRPVISRWKRNEWIGKIDSKGPRAPN